MAKALPTADQIIPLYEKYHIDWAMEEYIDGVVQPRACASGICLIDRLGDRGAAEALIEDQVDDLDVQARIAKTLNWPDPFLTGVIYGNDGDALQLLKIKTKYRDAPEEEQALYLQGYEVGKTVRETFYTPDEEDGDEEGW
jgi:hypothetical protein